MRSQDNVWERRNGSNLGASQTLHFNKVTGVGRACGLPVPPQDTQPDGVPGGAVGGWAGIPGCAKVDCDRNTCICRQCERDSPGLVADAGDTQSVGSRIQARECKMAFGV